MRKSILWIDDEIEYLRSHIEFLESRGYDVAKADSGVAAIQLIEENPRAYDIVLLDKQMPVKSGLATLDEIKTIAPDLPVVVLTGYQHCTDVAFEDKIDGYLTKPIDPNRILQECKRIIDSRQETSDEVVARYTRAYTENLERLNRSPNAAGFISLCRDTAMWDIEMEGAVSEGMRQLHAGLRYDTTNAFCSYAAENYPDWIRAAAGRPMLPVDIMEKAIAPELNAGRSVFLITLSGMRLDQFLSIEPELKKHFAVSRAAFLSLLPTTPEYTLPPLVSGLFPDDLHKLEPELYKRKNGFCDPAIMARVMSRGLDRSGAGDEKAGADANAAKIKTHFADAGGVGSAERVRAAMEVAKNAPAYVVVYLDAMEIVINPCQIGDPNAIPPQTPAMDCAALRTRVRSKILGGGILEMMNLVCSNSCTVILTSDHGHVLCDRPAVIYETPKIDGLRHTFARDAAADERAVVVVNDLSHFRLPPQSQRSKCLLARGNRYFTLAEKYGGSIDANSAAFRRGGISPEEMIMPVYICKPKGSS